MSNHKVQVGHLTIFSLILEKYSVRTHSAVLEFSHLTIFSLTCKQKHGHTFGQQFAFANWHQKIHLASLYYFSVNSQGAVLGFSYLTHFSLTYKQKHEHTFGQ